MVGVNPHLDAYHLLNGLAQIPKLSIVLHEVIHHPIAKKLDNLAGFKTAVRNSLRKHTPNYVFINNQIFADFNINRTLLKKRGSLYYAGYNDKFIIAVTSAMVSMHLLINDIETYSDKMNALQNRILESLMHAGAEKQRLIRKQYESCFTIHGSILTTGPIQYLTLALTTLETLTQCYTD